ncbi:GNAT family N-acetyltransferase [Leclercia adecarboxylata]|uniref:GNAT family N-acetyltransferase n=1 Tax=Leclercia barmai TaxID=2785629 RepID=A0ABS7RTZ1_9ENTR|nr:MULTISPECIES: GNAT family N-acetyltransferase [Enterobacteriaceae]MBZ0057752.1 GNAT family N-acetyltransferase [Leclercia sp. EMC7]MCM5696480.1 GNAT family N-acetyltransferase [Leclercia sp. LTM01]MCM5700320.1 GNAT family N-acetyltransferase [Leclercia sp. LTM14]QCZ27782.1 GNAT family N-acetyltransferase [Leclercia adecarboxylata]TLU67442.1 GNAT family N-acetyltransferase [Enterobacter sp. MF024]
MANLTIRMFSHETQYDLTEFDCGESTLNRFLFDHLARQHGGRLLRAYLLITDDPVPKVLGYYTLSGSCFEKESLPSKTQQRKVPYVNVPSVTLGRLAIHQDLQGQGWGMTLVTHAMKVVHLASQAVGIHGMFVDALNDRAKDFYLKLGFVALTGSNVNSLFYPTKSIEKLFAG